MKTFLILSVLALGVNALTKEQYSALMTKIQEVGGSCVEKEKATPEDLAELVAHKIPPTSHEAKCVLACFYEHYKMLKPDGTWDKQASIDAFAEVKDMDADLYAKMMQILETCYAKKQVVEDRCETASLMATCAKTEADSLGVTKEAFLVS